MKRSTEQASEDNELQKNDCLKLAAELEKQHEIKCRNFVTFKQTMLNSIVKICQMKHNLIFLDDLEHLT